MFGLGECYLLFKQRGAEEEERNSGEKRVKRLKLMHFHSILPSSRHSEIKFILSDITFYFELGILTLTFRQNRCESDYLGQDTVRFWSQDHVTALMG